MRAFPRPEPSVICPNCRTLVPDGLSICDACNHILDTSFLGDDILNDAEREAEATRIKSLAEVEKARDADRTRIRPADAVKQDAGRKSGRKAPLPAAAVADFDELPAAGRRLDEVAAPPPATAEALEDLARDFRALPRSEKFSVVGSGLLLLALAFPWKASKTTGDVIGMLSDAWWLSLVSFGIFGALVARRHPALQKWRDWILQASAALSLVACVGILFFMKSAVVMRTVREGRKVFSEATSWPAFGVYLGLLGALLALAGAIKTWLDREQLDS